MIATAAEPCALCGRRSRRGESRLLDGRRLAYCCRGCGEVHAFLLRQGAESAVRAATPTAPVPSGPTERAGYCIRGLWCPSCAWGLEAYLRRAPGIVAARVDFLDACCQVEFRAGAVNPPALIAALGFTAIAVDEPGWNALGDLALRAGLALFLAMGVMALSWSGYLPALVAAGEAGAGNLVDGVAALAAGLVIFICGWPILRGGWLALRHGAANMDTLIALSGLAAYALSAYQWRHARLAYFDIPAMLFAFLLVGRWLEARLRIAALRGRERWQPPPILARRLAADGAVARVAAADLAVGDEILLRPGDRVPADCHVLSGSLRCDESLLTGEARPLRRDVGEELIGGARITAVERAATARALVLRLAGESRPTALAAEVERTRDARARSERARRLDRWAAYFVPAIGAMATITLAANLAWGAGLATAGLRAVSVLIFACPCTLGLALPLIEERALGAAARQGMLVQNLDALAELPACDTIVLDKTGTVTEGVARVVGYAALARVRAAAAGGSASFDDADPFAVAEALERATAHPHGEAIHSFAARRTASRLAEPHCEVTAGAGVRGWLAEDRTTEWRLGCAAFAAPGGLSDAMARVARQARAAGDSVVVLARAAEAVALFAIRDRARPAARRVIATWRRRHDVWLVSGDDPAATAAAARQVGIARAQGATSPGQKAALIGRLRAEGRRVAMIGDGNNDAPALAAAQVGIALARGALLPCAAAAVTLLEPDFAALDRLFALGRELRRRERLGLVWAALYNAGGLPLAAIGWIGPLAAALAMVASSLSLLAAAMRPFRSLAVANEREI